MLRKAQQRDRKQRIGKLSGYAPAVEGAIDEVGQRESRRRVLRRGIAKLALMSEKEKNQRRYPEETEPQTSPGSGSDFPG